MKNLYLIRGLPGSGKSTLAKTLALGVLAIHAEADGFLYEGGEYNWSPERAAQAHHMCQRKVKSAMVSGVNVVVSNTLTTEKEMKPYLQLAEEFGYTVTSVIVENRHGNISIHDVPEETMNRMKNRFSVKL